MVATVIISTLTIAAMITTVLLKPYTMIKGHKVGLYYVVCLIGAILLLLTGCISFDSVIKGVTAPTAVNPLKILTLFLSMTLLSIFLGDAGFFNYVAVKIFLKAKGSKLKIFFVLYAVVAILTIFTSNDVIILTFTPPICIFAKKAKISPLPFLFGEFIAANTWSMMLIVGNPTNVYLAGAAGIEFMGYFSVMALPAILGGLVGLFALLIIFRKDLKTPVPVLEQTEENGPQYRIHKFPMIISLIHLILCIVALAVSDLIGVEMWLICLAAAISLTVISSIYHLIKAGTLRPTLFTLKSAPYELIPFILSMFVLVLALSEQGVTSVLSSLLISGTKTDGVVFGVLGTLLSNLLNNIPMSVLSGGIISGTSIPATFGAIIGSNIGAFLTPVGALAGIMWSKILSGYDVKLPFSKFVLYGASVAIPTVIASVLGLMLVL